MSSQPPPESANLTLAEIMAQLSENLPESEHAAIQSQLSAYQPGAPNAFPHPSAPVTAFSQQQQQQNRPAGNTANATPGQFRPNNSSSHPQPTSYTPQQQFRPSNTYAYPPTTQSGYQQQPQYQPTPPPARRPVGRPPGPSRSLPTPSSTPLAQQHTPVDPHSFYVFPPPLPLQPFTSGPLPLFATVSTNRQRNAQAMHTTYPSRLRTGVSTLMQPIIPFTAAAPTAGMGAGKRTGGRGGAVNYAEVDGKDEEESEEESDDSSSDGDATDVKGEAGGENNYGRKTGGAVGRLGRVGRRDSGTPDVNVEGGGPGANKRQKKSTERSYLGDIPPGDKVVIKPMTRTKHEYPSEAELATAARQKAIMIPIRIDFDTDTHRIRDCFTWNLNESLLTPLQFAKIFCHDTDLPFVNHGESIAAQIKAQLDEFASVAEIEVGYDETLYAVAEGEPAVPTPAEAATTEGTPAPGVNGNEGGGGGGGRKRKRERGGASTREGTEAPIEEEEEGDEEAQEGEGEADTAVNSTAVGTPMGEGEAEMGEDGEGEEGEEQDGEEQEQEAEEEEAEEEEEVEMESDCRIIVNLDVQLFTHSLRDRIEWDLSSSLSPYDFSHLLAADLGLSSECVPLIAHAIHEELLKHKKDAIEMGLVGAGWRALPEGTSRAGPRKLAGVWRGWEEQEDFGPTLVELTAEDIERREVERERASRRARRETARFTSNSANVRFRRR